jgi:hypothetical protein
MNKSARLRPSTLLSAGIVAWIGTCATAHAQFTLNEIGGSLKLGNYGTLGTTSAFGKDEIGGGTLPVHKIPQIRDGIFGNSNSWIGDSDNSFVGLNFGTAPVSVGRIAWGRDNTATYIDRTAGIFTLDYTLVSNPGAALPFTGNAATGWATVGSIDYLTGGTAGSPISQSLRHEWSFAPVMATGVRLTAPGSSFANGACIDELEAYSFAATPLTLAQTGGTMRAGNLALSSLAFGKDELNYFNGTEFIHQIADINDGIYGNSNSWIGNSEASFIGLNFNGSFTIDRFAFGRDNTDTFTDRARGTYLLQYTTAASPNQNTADNLWTNIGPLLYTADGITFSDRHEYAFAPVTATGVRLIASGNGGASGVAVDEIEAYKVVPEPGTGALLLLGLAAGLRRRR